MKKNTPRIKHRDPETDRGLVFLTNNFALLTLMIVEFYRQRWQVELFCNPSASIFPKMPILQVFSNVEQKAICLNFFKVHWRVLRWKLVLGVLFIPRRLTSVAAASTLGAENHRRRCQERIVSHMRRVKSAPHLGHRRWPRKTLLHTGQRPSGSSGIRGVGSFCAISGLPQNTVIPEAPPPLRPVRPYRRSGQ